MPWLPGISHIVVPSAVGVEFRKPDPGALSSVSIVWPCTYTFMGIGSYINDIISARIPAWNFLCLRGHATDCPACLTAVGFAFDVALPSILPLPFMPIIVVFYPSSLWVSISVCCGLPECQPIWRHMTPGAGCGTLVPAIQFYYYAPTRPLKNQVSLSSCSKWITNSCNSTYG